MLLRSSRESRSFCGLSFSSHLFFSTGYSIIPLCRWVGVLSLGIGDTFSAVVGSKLGRLKWSQTNKTVEGTLAAIVSQIAFLGAVGWFALEETEFKSAEATPTIAIAWILIVTANSLLETFTYQIDNLILSLTVIPSVMNIGWLHSILSDQKGGN